MKPINNAPNNPDSRFVTIFPMRNLPSTIDAIAIRKNGGLDVLEKITLPFPEIHPTDIVVKSYLCINYIDTYMRSGLYPSHEFPAILGGEGAGTIAALPTDAAVLCNPQYRKQGFVLGSRVAVAHFGIHSTYATVPWYKVIPVSPCVPMRAAASASNAVTAVTFLEEAYKVQKGDIILIHTVAGGLGLLMCQLAKALGAIVIGTTSTAAKAEVAHRYGADHVIIYKSENTVERVLQLTQGEGVHAIFDGVGKDTFKANFDMIRRKGTLVSLGNASGAVPPFPPLDLSKKNIKLVRPLLGNYVTTPEEFEYYGSKAFGMIENGTLVVEIFKDYPFTTNGVREAHDDLTSGRTVGRLLIDVNLV